MAICMDRGAKLARSSRVWLHIKGGLKSAWVFLWEHCAIARERRQLRALTDEQLKDIGLSAMDVERETRRFFWQRCHLPRL